MPNIEDLPTFAVCSCHSEDLAIEGAEEARRISQERMIEMESRSPRTTPDDESQSIGLVIHLVGNVDDANQVSDAQIFGNVKQLNRLFDQTSPDIATQTPTSIQPLILDRPIGYHFYVKDITRNFVLPSGIWHSQFANENTDYFGTTGITTTMCRGNRGGVDPDRADKYINVVIANFSSNGLEPYFWDGTRFPNLSASGFAWLPADWALYNPSNNGLFFQRLVLLSSYVGGSDSPEEEAGFNQVYRDLGFTVPQYYFRGQTLAHEMGHLLDLQHTWGSTSPAAWNNPSFFNCGKTFGVDDIEANDGYFLGSGNRDGWSGPPEDLYQPMPGRIICGENFGDGFPVCYSNIMNYGNDDRAVMFTPDQRSRMRRTCQGLYPTFKTLVETPAPIDFNNRTSDIASMIVNGKSATRAYMGSNLVWTSLDNGPIGPPDFDDIEISIDDTYWVRGDGESCGDMNDWENAFSGIHNITDPGRMIEYASKAHASANWYGWDAFVLDTYTKPNEPFEMVGRTSTCTDTDSGDPYYPTVAAPFVRIRFKLSDGTITDWAYSPNATKEII